jgi:hypothetical protein
MLGIQATMVQGTGTGNPGSSWQHFQEDSLILGVSEGIMSDQEFDLLDELYFVQPYAFLKETLGWEDQQLLETLTSLVEKGWIKCFTEPDQECFEAINLQEVGMNLLYLATKKGLMAHTSL